MHPNDPAHPDPARAGAHRKAQPHEVRTHDVRTPAAAPAAENAATDQPSGENGKPQDCCTPRRGRALVAAFTLAYMLGGGALVLSGALWSETRQADRDRSTVVDDLHRELHDLQHVVDDLLADVGPDLQAAIDRRVAEREAEREEARAAALDAQIATRVQNYIRDPASSLEADLQHRDGTRRQAAQAELSASIAEATADPETRQALADPATTLGPPTLGPPTPATTAGADTPAHVTLVEFADVRCPYCRQTDQAMHELWPSLTNVSHRIREVSFLGEISAMGAAAIRHATPTLTAGAEADATSPEAVEASRHALWRAILQDAEWQRWSQLRELAAEHGHTLPLVQPTPHPTTEANEERFRALGLTGTPSLLAWTADRATVTRTGGMGAEGLRALIDAARNAPHLSDEAAAE